MVTHARYSTGVVVVKYATRVNISSSSTADGHVVVVSHSERVSILFTILRTVHGISQRFPRRLRTQLCRFNGPSLDADGHCLCAPRVDLCELPELFRPDAFLRFQHSFRDLRCTAAVFVRPRPSNVHRWRASAEYRDIINRISKTECPSDSVTLLSTYLQYIVL
uniref:Uncharacterized protein n=1 Tax=Sipha flava TaxID=143950 RepID=A0A2S2QUR3_9HEMI